MKEIKLTQGMIAVVDDQDFEFLSQWKWVADKGRNTFYAKRSSVPQLRMHRIIISPPKKKLIDHIDRNGLNNQRNNLRICNHTQNNCNRKSYGISIYLGVWWSNRDMKWCAQISVKGKRKSLGYFKNEDDAAVAYNKGAKKYHGEFAKLNII